MQIKLIGKSGFLNEFIDKFHETSILKIRGNEDKREKMKIFIEKI